MAYRAPPSFCADAAYQKFLPLQGFSPAKDFCSNLAVHQESNNFAANLNSVDPAAHAAKWREWQCPAGSSLCSLLSDLQAADSTFSRNVCRCIGVYVVVPGNGISGQLATEVTTRPMAGHTNEPMTRPSNKDASTPITETLLSTTSSPESSRTTFIESKITTISEWVTTSLSTASMPPNSVTVLVASSTFPTTIYSTSISILSELSRSSSTSTRLSSPATEESISSSSSSSIFPSSTSSSHSTTSATSASTLVATSTSASCLSTCSSSSSSSSSTSSLRFSTCAYPTATTACPTVTAAGLAYKEYYSGQYHTENTANPGTGGEPAIYTRFRGAYDMCAAAQYCANAAGAAYGPYHSFDLHYTCSNSSWMCVQYFNGNSDASYLNVLNLDVVIAFGYSY